MATLSDVFKLITLSRAKALSSFSMFSDVDSYFNYHQQRVIENWQFYSGNHQLFFTPFREEDTKDFAERISNATIENQIKPIIDLITSHLYKGEDSIKRFIKRKDKPDEKLQSLIEEISLKTNDYETYDDTKSLNAIITGYSIVQKQLIDLRTGLPFNQFDSKFDIPKFGIIKKKVLDSQNCIALPFVDEWGIIDSSRLGAILQISDYDTFIGNDNAKLLLGENRPRRKSKVIEYIDDNVWLRWIKYEEDNDFRQIPVFPGTNYVNTNPYKNINIPFVVYRNTGDPFYIEGDSDVIPLKTMNLELDELGDGDKQTIRYHQFPILVGYNGASLPDNFKRTKDAFIGLGQGNKDQKLDYLTWEGKLEASDKRQETLRRSMSQVIGVSLISRGFLKEIGQIRSGPPLKALFTSDRATMSRKFKFFGAAEKADMYSDLKLYEFHTGVSLNIDRTVTFHAKFNQDFLGIDKLLEEEIKSIKAQSGTETIEEIMREEHPDWSDEEIQKAIKKIEEQRQAKSLGQRQKSTESAALSQENR